LGTQNNLMQSSSLPLLTVIVFGFLVLLIVRAYRRGVLERRQRDLLVILLAVLGTWGGLSGFFSVSGIYRSEGFLLLAPGYWLPFVPVIITMLFVLLVRPLRDGLRVLIDETPRYWLTGVHVIRILAIGSLVKASNGLFPETFAWYVGIPDLLFGLSALPVTVLAWRGRIASLSLAFWHVAGAAVIIVPSVGFMHVYMQDPLFDRLFEFPMALAPTLVVPMLVMLNLLAAWRLLEKRWSVAITFAPRSQ